LGGVNYEKLLVIPIILILISCGKGYNPGLCYQYMTDNYEKVRLLEGRYIYLAQKDSIIYRVEMMGNSLKVTKETLMFDLHKNKE